MQSVNDSRALTGKNRGLNRTERAKVQPGSKRAQQNYINLKSELGEVNAAITAGKVLLSTTDDDARKNLKRSMRKLYGQRDRLESLVKAAKAKANS